MKLYGSYYWIVQHKNNAKYEIITNLDEYVLNTLVICDKIQVYKLNTQPVLS